MSGEPYYVTTPIFYVNDAPHIGHAYAMVACDVLARFMRLDGRRVHYLTGTDEHGQKVDKSARAAGLDPKTFCDRVSQNFRDATKLMNISNDDFIRTTEPRHIKASQAIWRAIAANQTPKGRPNIYLEKYDGWYAVRDEAFYGEGNCRPAPTASSARRREPRWSGWRSPAISSDFPIGGSGCWTTIETIRTSSRRNRGVTRW
jgi:methionyl-tRNA synthetase